MCHDVPIPDPCTTPSSIRYLASLSLLLVQSVAASLTSLSTPVAPQPRVLPCPHGSCWYNICLCMDADDVTCFLRLHTTKPCVCVCFTV
ncbi:hypothetical protein E2C01_099152 [Portunus trituberculatus]|uniref:Secreted protein n=1 Tax=Portunus trituberculatus TaxID=210409 RepID=A0A5B7K339_PORTR|nr:hypothetical protein [Portunus trituberculatus]